MIDNVVPKFVRSPLLDDSSTMPQVEMLAVHAQ
jgi:hypothetical protein